MQQHTYADMILYGFNKLRQSRFTSISFCGHFLA